jgi:predicted peptidase
MRMLLWMSVMTTSSWFGLSPQEALPPAESRPVHEQLQPVTGFLYRTIEVGNETYAYCVYVPPEYTPERAWPVILFLHGSGERGHDGFLQTDVGIARAIRRNRELCPAIVVMPQCRAGKWWEDDMLDMALRCVEETSREYHFDRERVYLTGLSMGGAGAWRLSSRMPDAFAALVPICGFWGRPEVAAPPAELEAAAARVGRLPVWCFHGAADTSVPVERSRELVEAVRAAGGEIHYTEVLEAGHNVWDRAYGDPDLWRWLLAQKREPQPEKTP